MPCDHPFYVNEIPVPCGKCAPCKKRRVDGWVFRLLEEEKISSSAHFVTLTYDTRFVPISDNGFMTLRKKDFQDYMKRLRKLCPEFKLRYYACGEYGTKNHRPHYHFICFNVPRETFFYDAWSLNGVPLGAVHVGKVTGDSIAYTMKYIDKSTWKIGHSRDDRKPEFAVMSQGLGLSYLSDEVVKYHKADLSRNYITREGGHIIAMPSYYRRKIYNSGEQLIQRSVIQEAVNASFDALRREFELNGYPESYTYGDWLSDQRDGRRIKFSSTIKDRKL